ncbi:hypothetical protein N9849_00155 [bacterium]|nr:hypothetical protein [bacterium]
MKRKIWEVVLPVGESGKIVSVGVGEVVCALGLGGGAGGEKGDFSRGKGEVGELEGAGGERGDLFPMGEGLRSDAQGFAEALVGKVVLKVDFKEFPCECIEVSASLLTDKSLYLTLNKTSALGVLA